MMNCELEIFGNYSVQRTILSWPFQLGSTLSDSSTLCFSTASVYRITPRKKMPRYNLRRRVSKNCTKQERDWSQLPSDILELICRKLFYIDQVNVRAVCRAWRCLNWVRPLRQMPWLMLFDGEIDEYSCKLVDPQYKKTYSISMDTVREKKFTDLIIHETKEGWLLISSRPKKNPPNAKLFLLNPFSTRDNLIELPVLHNPFSIATFSSNPSKEDFVLLTLNCSSSNAISITSLRLGDDSWKTKTFECQFPISRIRSVVYSKGIFYITSNVGSIGSFDVARQKWYVLPKPVLPEPHLDKHWIDVYLMKITDDQVDDKLFVMFLNKNHVDWGSLEFTFYMLNRIAMAWEVVTDIPCLVMFLGSGCTSFMREDRNWRLGSRVYFISDTMLKYCALYLADRSYPCTKLYGPLAKSSCKKVWVEPPQFQ